MSYEPTTWKSGDTVTSAKLNKIEQGIANAGGGGGGSNVVVVGIAVTRNNDESVTVTSDKTFAELKTAYEGGAILICNISAEDNLSSSYGRAAAFLWHYPAEDEDPETFSCESSFMDGVTGNACALGVNFVANETTAYLYAWAIPNS